jgi:hypothetical protein
LSFISNIKKIIFSNALGGVLREASLWDAAEDCGEDDV